jgi:hypothetical protein
LKLFLNFSFVLGKKIDEKLLLGFHNLLYLLDWLFTLLIEAAAWAPGQPLTPAAAPPIASVARPAASASTPSVFR